MSAAGRVLVTGATGFIGARLVERLARQGRAVRIVTSDFRRCARVARFPVEMVKADLTDAHAFARTADGCETIFHLAYRFGGSASEQLDVNLQATRALAEAALAAGSRTFVHFSSIAAYGAPADGIVTEATAPRPAADAYSKSKRALDDMLAALHATRRLPVTIVQPTIVYGPYGGTWTTPLLSLVTSGRIVLPASDSGLCNAVYVDDVVSAALLASQSAAAIGEAFLVSGREPVSWSTFYGAYARIAGTDAVTLMDDAQLLAESRRIQKGTSLARTLRNALARRPELRERLLAIPPQRWLVQVGRKVLPAPVREKVHRQYENFWQLPPAVDSAVYVPDPASLALYSARTRVSIDKARKVLGFEPAFDLERGMALTGHWARWANVVPS